MKKKTKLAVAKEVVRTLKARDLGEVVAGLSGNSGADTVTVSSFSNAVVPAPTK